MSTAGDVTEKVEPVLPGAELPLETLQGAKGRLALLLLLQSESGRRRKHRQGTCLPLAAIAASALLGGKHVSIRSASPSDLLFAKVACLCLRSNRLKSERLQE